ncbi:DUF4123 domain-containing protein [Swingsia samuiensis]|uniref:DUF4123 domain-containing protein n=1 Tax=Swingsia samuiensis TaxID=1293412 RepID=A0A4Y6UKP9_9PROT|nr:DUF4123 domain-containing protein [Swingsia samuiensis]QDH17380.1 DUF4123 domain-containing protein [Swingsia samuiensis]
MNKLKRQIQKKIDAWPHRPIFIAMDGAQFDNLPNLLRKNKIFFKSLFLDRKPGSVGRSGPFLATIAPHQGEFFLSLPDVLNGSVFWNAQCSFDTFYRHLRTLSLVRIPSQSEEKSKTRMVVFRHFDPKTIALILPIMTLPQRARFFGPAQSLLISVPEGVLEAKRRSNWPEPEKGFLSFDQEKMNLITDAMKLRSHHKIAKFLRDTAPDQTKDMNDEALLKFVERSEEESKIFEVTTEAGKGRFAWLQLMSHEKFSKDPAIITYMKSVRHDPDLGLKHLISMTSKVHMEKNKQS